MSDGDDSACSHSVIVAAAAFRAKYRATHQDGTVAKLKLPIGALGVHQKNRSGAYPAGVRCLALCEEVVEVGFSCEEVNQHCVAVEECPVEHVQRLVDGTWQKVHPEGSVSGTVYNF